MTKIDSAFADAWGDAMARKYERPEPPCRFCGSPVRLVPFQNAYVEQTTLRFCSNSQKFRGDCPDKNVYLSKDGWARIMTEKPRG